MRTRIIPAADVLTAHEQAALEIGELRRKGIHCHLEENAGREGPQLDVVCDPEPESEERQDSREAHR